jgi:hypothetical protein
MVSPVDSTPVQCTGACVALSIHAIEPESAVDIILIHIELGRYQCQARPLTGRPCQISNRPVTRRNLCVAWIQWPEVAIQKSNLHRPDVHDVYILVRDLIQLLADLLQGGRCSRSLRLPRH